MDPNALREHLETLHGELGDASELDPESKRLLAGIMHDIRRLVDGASADPASPGAATPEGRSFTDPSLTRDDSLPDRLERIAVQFEVDHPTLAASSRRLVDLLGKVGL